MSKIPDNKTLANGFRKIAHALRALITNHEIPEIGMGRTLIMKIMGRNRNDKPRVCSCLGGLIAYSLMDNVQFKKQVKREMQAYRQDQFLEHPKGRLIDYTDGLAIMSKLTGFKKGNDISEWALANADVWGNTYGNTMFCSLMAFGCTNATPTAGVELVAKHFEDVANRLDVK